MVPTMTVQVQELDVDALLEVPEIKEAFERFTEIKEEYLANARQIIHATPLDELPDLTNLYEEYETRLEAQKTEVRRLVTEHQRAY